MFANVLKSVGIVAAVALITSVSGCMSEPGNYETIGKRSDLVYFDGYTPTADETVQVWAKKNTGGWKMIGETQTFPYDNGNLGPTGPWNRWLAPRVVPNDCWKKVPYTNLYTTEIKATNATYGDLYTFEPGFSDYVLDYDDYIELYEDHGAGNSITIFATK